MLMEEEGCAKIYWHLATSHTHISHLARKEVNIFLDIRWLHSHPSAEILDAANHMTSNALSWRQLFVCLIWSLRTVVINCSSIGVQNWSFGIYSTPNTSKYHKKPLVWLISAAGKICLRKFAIDVSKCTTSVCFTNLDLDLFPAIFSGFIFISNYFRKHCILNFHPLTFYK